MRGSLTLIRTLICLASYSMAFVSCAPRRESLRAQLNPDYVQALAAFKRLEPKITRHELRAVTTIGILNGVVQTEHRMEQHLVELLKDLLRNTDATQVTQIKPKIEKIEKQLKRDQRALEILTSSLDLATHSMNLTAFKQEMQQKLNQNKAEDTRNHHNHQKNDNYNDDEDGGDDDDVRQRVASLRRNILLHVHAMKQLVDEKIHGTLKYLIAEAPEDGLLAKANYRVMHKRSTRDVWGEERAEVRLIKSILTEDDFRNNFIDVFGDEKRKNIEELLGENLDLDELTKKVKANRTPRLPLQTTTTTTRVGTLTSFSSLPTTTATTKTTTAINDFARPVKQEEASPEIEIGDADEGGAVAGGGDGGGGGLVGIITSLSGGEGGSDVGALIGALTGLVSTLFGPGGLDVEALISTATSLISGLLAGNKNFGTVLGQYVGTAFDGLSGGGGAVNNGQFIGNFLGTVVASLSADPEDDDEPPKPLIFVQNLFNSFVEAKNRKASDEERDSGERGGSGEASPSGGGFDSAGFIKHIVSHVVGGAVSLILNAALGASGGSSQASSSSLFASSSPGHKPGSGNNIKLW